MEQRERFKMFENGVKLIALYQATLEQMDTMKSTALYKHNIKKMMRTLEREIERAIRAPLVQLDATDETMMSTIQYKVEAILDLSLEELAMLKMVIEEHREKQDPFGEHFEINTSAAKEK
jgi:uncharacterized protein YlaN (UPF0358 family)